MTLTIGCDGAMLCKQRVELNPQEQEEMNQSHLIPSNGQKTTQVGDTSLLIFQLIPSHDDREKFNQMLFFHKGSTGDTAISVFLPLNLLTINRHINNQSHVSQYKKAINLITSPNEQQIQVGGTVQYSFQAVQSKLIPCPIATFSFKTTRILIMLHLITNSKSIVGYTTVFIVLQPGLTISYTLMDSVLLYGIIHGLHTMTILAKLSFSIRKPLLMSLQDALDQFKEQDYMGKLKMQITSESLPSDKKVLATFLYDLAICI
ncbi:hypothetical protein F5887DRAFT_925084 [Amanita rubescens]|nr:hypothetical protein F5887DRAFT_925084 [Amanita rubescens]